MAPSPQRRRTTLAVLAISAVVGLGAAFAWSAWEARPAQEVVAAAPAAASGSSTTTSVVAATSSLPATTVPEGDELGSGQNVSIAFAGDMYFEGVLRERLLADHRTAVGPFTEVLRGADLAVGNLETAIATGGTRADKQFAFRAPPLALDALGAAGFDTVSMANNHGMDYGRDGLAESLAARVAAPPGFVIGIGADEDDAYTPFSAVVRGQRIAVIAATQVIDNSVLGEWTATATQGGLASAKRVGRLVEEVERARTGHDTVVVYLHWGIETHTCPSRDQQMLAEALADAGADVIVGGHAHRVQGGGRLGRAVVHYGLGNFLFKEHSAEGARTGVFVVEVTGRRVDGYRWVPGRISGSVPRPLDGAEASEALAHWEGLRACTGLDP
jgi:poly-gamma-glutamate capsule biosynthesis protein CapA/YwtB (metallophosphatase superfamily)